MGAVDPAAGVVGLVLIIGTLGDTGPTTNEERVVAIARTVKCPECSGESVAESNSSFSRAARIEIAEQVQAGRTDDEVGDYLDAKYPGILAHADELGRRRADLDHPGGGVRVLPGRTGRRLPAVEPRGPAAAVTDGDRDAGPGGARRRAPRQRRRRGRP